MVTFKVTAQTKETPIASNLTVESFSYPLFLNNEKHSSLDINYSLTNTLDIAFQNHFDTYILEDRLRTALGLKQYLTKKIYVAGGVEMEFARDKLNNSWKLPARSSINGILGYDINNNMFIEAKGNFQLNDTNWGPYGELLIPMKEVYSLGGKWKF